MFSNFQVFDWNSTTQGCQFRLYHVHRIHIWCGNYKNIWTIWVVGVWWLCYGSQRFHNVQNADGKRMQPEYTTVSHTKRSTHTRTNSRIWKNCKCENTCWTWNPTHERNLNFPNPNSNKSVWFHKPTVVGSQCGVKLQRPFHWWRCLKRHGVSNNLICYEQGPIFITKINWNWDVD